MPKKTNKNFNYIIFKGKIIIFRKNDLKTTMRTNTERKPNMTKSMSTAAKTETWNATRTEIRDRIDITRIINTGEFLITCKVL